MSREEAYERIGWIHEHPFEGIHSAKKVIDELFDIIENLQSKKAVVVKKPKFLVSDMLCEYPNVNHNAFMEWMAYKKYKNKGAVTKTLNMLNRHSFEVQQEMVDNSIRNEYKGLFEPKVQRSRTDYNVGVAMDWLNENDVFECEVIEHVE